MRHVAKSLSILLVGPFPSMGIRTALSELGWAAQPCDYQTWVEWGGPAGAWDAALIDCTGTPPSDSWLHIHHMVSRVSYPLVLVTAGSVPSSFHYPRAGGLRVGLLRPESGTDQIRSTIDLVRTVYLSVRPGLAEVPQCLDDDRASEALDGLMRIRQEIEELRVVLTVGDDPRPTPPHALGTRERDVCSLILQGLSIGTVAHRLGITESTVKKHLNSIYRKRGVTSRAQLMAGWDQPSASSRA